MPRISFWKPSTSWAAVAAFIIVAGVPRVASADETRTFAVTVDGKAAGTYAVTSAAGADETESITSVADVKIKAALLTYTYQLSCTEIWKNGQLASVESKTNDNGKRRAMSAVAGVGGLNVTSNKVTRKASANAITSTGVRVPTGDQARDAALLDCEDGSETAVRVESLGTCRVTLNGKAIEGTRYKLTGKGVAAEWWFDANGRSIRQENKWDGHKVVFELSSISQ